MRVLPAVAPPRNRSDLFFPSPQILISPVGPAVYEHPMDRREQSFLYAAMRLWKSSMRRYICENRTNLLETTREIMRILEVAVERASQQEWGEVLAVWDLTDPRTRLRAEYLVSEAFQRSVRDTLDDEGDSVASLLIEFTSTHSGKEILQVGKAPAACCTQET